jgi:hypothetical protein
MTPPAPITGSAKKAATVSGPLAHDQVVQLLREAAGELLLRLAGPPLAVVMRRADVEEARQRQVEKLVVVRQAGDGSGGERDAVVAAQAADDLLLLWLADGVVHVPEDLDDAVVRLRAGVGEEHLAHRHRRALDQHLGEIDQRLVRLGGEGVVEGQLPHLVGRRLHQPLVAEAERRAPQPGHALDVFLALVVPDPHALAAADDHGALLQVRLVVGVGVQGVGDVAGGGGVAGRGHRSLLAVGVKSRPGGRGTQARRAPVLDATGR